jgi:hypothetical protein
LALQYFDFYKSTLWTLLQKHTLRTKLDAYVFVTSFFVLHNSSSEL